MYTFEEVASILDDVVDQLPQDITRTLNGGVNLVPEAKPHPKLPFPEYVVMGQYVRGGGLGQTIFVYYGSVMAKYVDADVEKMKSVLTEIVRHEFLHHVESQAGCRDLEIEDEKFVEKALASEVCQAKNLSNFRKIMHAIFDISLSNCI